MGATIGPESYLPVLKVTTRSEPPESALAALRLLRVSSAELSSEWASPWRLASTDPAGSERAVASTTGC